MLFYYPALGVPTAGKSLIMLQLVLISRKLGRIYCLAGIAAHVNGMVESAKGAKRIVAMDGCQVACAKKAIEHAGVAGNRLDLCH